MGRMSNLSLKAFSEAVEQQLTSRSADELRSILWAMAQQTTPTERVGFLEKLGHRECAVNVVRRTLGTEDLLADIDAVIQEVRDATDHAEDWDDAYRWDDYDDEDSLGPYEEFTETIAGLFDRVEAAFDYGNLTLARAAYEALFGALRIEDDYGRGVRLSDLDGVDGDQARARYLRAVYETEPPETRVRVLFEKMREARSWGCRSRPTLDELMQISPQPLPDRDRFLADSITLLRTQSDSDSDAWLREAVRLSQGTDGLEKLARSEGERRPRVYLDWLAALETQDKHRDVVAVAERALAVLPAAAPIRAAIADHLCTAAVKLDDIKAVRSGRWQAFAAKPILPRLLDLWDAAPQGANRTKRMRQAARHVLDYLAEPPDDDVTAFEWRQDDIEMPALADKCVLAHAYLLGCDWDAAHRLAKAEEVLGWSYGGNPQGLIVSFFLTCLSETTPGTQPPNLSQLWRWSLASSVGAGLWHVDEEGRTGEHERLDRAYLALLEKVTLSMDKQKTMLAWCLDVAKRRTTAIVSSQHRRSYKKAAVLIAAGAEVLRLREDKNGSDTLIEEIRGRFPRHRAFQGELDTAILHTASQLE